MLAAEASLCVYSLQHEGFIMASSYESESGAESSPDVHLSEYHPLIEEWMREHPHSQPVRLIAEDPDEGFLVLRINGAVFQVYIPQGEDASYFLTTEGEDPRLHEVLTELNDMPHIRSLPSLLTQVHQLLAKRSGCTGLPVPTRQTSASSDAVEDGLLAVDAPDCERSQMYTVHDFESLQATKSDLVTKVAERLAVEEDQAELLLMRCGWSKEALFRSFESEIKASALCSAAGVVLASRGAAKVETLSAPLCCVCFDARVDACLPCGHGLCAVDWPQFLKCNLDSGTVGGGNCLWLKCAGERCSLTVPPSFFERFLEPFDFERYRRLSVLSFVNDNTDIVWCPADGCELAVSSSELKSTATCACGKVFCISCGLDAHAPAKCSSAKAWLQRKEDLSGLKDCGNVDFNTKRCPNPNCGVLSEKASGCHYLMCPHCKEKWCWQCGDWGGGPSGRPEPHHVSDCNAPMNQEWAKAASAINMFENEGKYWFYFERYQNHLSSLEFAEQLRRKVMRMVCEIKESERYHIQDIQLIHDASDLLIECRLVLAWTFVYAFFEGDEARRRLFEFVQADLEKRTEQLSLMTENRPTEDVLCDRVRLMDYVFALRGYLENIKTYTTIDAEAIAAKPAPGGAVLDLTCSTEKEAIRDRAGMTMPRTVKRKRKR